MSAQESVIYSKLTEVFQDVFDEDDLALTPETTADDVEGWDSMAHVRLLLSIKKKFGIEFAASETSSLKNVGDLVAVIAKKSK
ncbi:acyl carrier protein [Pseudomonas sp. App30]|jgi:acyl carrier protein|uniref:acyl carrier protein n=1 Tax=Pseudomonas sp. App30 TaxID=3068990 RepID=UPI003A80B2C2